MVDLTLGRNGIGDAGAMALAPSLALLTKLTQLLLDENNLRDAGLLHLVPSLAFLTALRCFECMDENRTDDPSCQANEFSVEALRKLRDGVPDVVWAASDCCKKRLLEGSDSGSDARG